MRIAAYVFGGLASFLHIVFFALESFMWATPQTNKIFKLTAEHAAVMTRMAYNQGFYNLFLAIGGIVGIIWLVRGKESQGQVLFGFAMLSMLGAALVLLSSSLQMIRGVMIQGLPPLLALVMLYLTRNKQA